MKKRKMSKLQRIENMQGWLSVLPVIVLELLICAYPIGLVVQKSFTNWDGMFKNDFVGFANYIKLFNDNNFWIMLRNTGVFLLTIPVQCLIGIVLAVILNDRMHGWKLFRFIYYLPSIISMVTIGLLFKILFSFNGPLNEILRSLGLNSFAVEWMGKGSTARLVIYLCLVWSNLGWQVLIIFGGLSNIPDSIFDAAKIDGAGFWNRIFRITIPMLVRTIEYSFITGMLWIFSGIFPLIHEISSGGPAFETTTLDYMIYIKGFTGTKLGQACSLSMVLLLLILVITLVQMKISNKLDDWG